MTVKLLVLCGGVGADILARDLPFQGVVYVDLREHLRERCVSSAISLQCVPLDGVSGTTGQLLLNFRQWMKRIEEPERLEKAQLHVETLEQYMKSNIMLDIGLQVSPALGGMAIRQDAIVEELRRAWDTLLSGADVGIDNPVEMWVVAPVSEGIGMGTHRFIGEDFARFMQSRFLDVPVKVSFLRWIKGIRDPQQALNAWVALSGDKAFDEYFARQFVDAALRWIYLLSDDMSAMPRIMGEIFSDEGDEFLDALIVQSRGNNVILVQGKVWEIDVQEDRKYYEALSQLSKALLEMKPSSQYDVSQLMEVVDNEIQVMEEAMSEGKDVSFVERVQLSVLNDESQDMLEDDWNAMWRLATLCKQITLGNLGTLKECKELVSALSFIEGVDVSSDVLLVEDDGELFTPERWMISDLIDWPESFSRAAYLRDVAYEKLTKSEDGILDKLHEQSRKILKWMRWGKLSGLLKVRRIQGTLYVEVRRLVELLSLLEQWKKSLQLAEVMLDRAKNAHLLLVCDLHKKMKSGKTWYDLLISSLSTMQFREVVMQGICGLSERGVRYVLGSIDAVDEERSIALLLQEAIKALWGMQEKINSVWFFPTASRDYIHVEVEPQAGPIIYNLTDPQIVLLSSVADVKWQRFPLLRQLNQILDTMTDERDDEVALRCAYAGVPGEALSKKFVAAIENEEIKKWIENTYLLT